MTFKCNLEFRPPDVSGLKKILVIIHLFTFCNVLCSNCQKTLAKDHFTRLSKLPYFAIQCNFEF